MTILPDTLRVHDFETPERTKQLEIIDKLHELGLGKDISLPLLVVVGDQSSGKSSLLEALTGLPFPIASQLCTRFATQVSFRRVSHHAHDVITISIVPGPKADDAHKIKLAKYGRELKELTSGGFKEVLDEATECMGIPITAVEFQAANKRFSSDVLKIEIAGPQQHHLSVVDGFTTVSSINVINEVPSGPNTFAAPTKDQTEEDLEIVRALIGSYVRDPRTIIMAVLDSRNNLANQEVFKIAKGADPDGTRTIGVMTKLDALQEGDEQAAIDIARNEVEFLKHGWYCVRNRSTQEVLEGCSMSHRNQKEKVFFDKPPFNKIDQKRTGIANLKTNLGRLLSDHIAREFPQIRKEIESRYAACLKQLEALGAPRQNTQEQRQYLTRIATVYQRKIEDVSTGRYAAAGMHPSKLRMHLQNASDRFNEKMLARGKTMAFKSTDDEYGPEANRLTPPQVTETPLFSPPESATTKSAPPTFAAMLASLETPSRLNDGSDSECSRKPRDIYQEIRLLWHTSRGTELPGHVNPSVLETLFNHQTKNWPKISSAHLDEITDIIFKANTSIFSDVCSDEVIRDRLWARIEPDAKSAFTAAKAELAALLNDERTGPLLTNNHYYAKNLAKARAERFVNGLKKLGLSDKAQNYINFQSIKNSMHLSNEQTAIYDIHDTLQAYYKVAIKRFIDNVKNQVVERNLMGSGGPVRLFSPDWVAGLDEAELTAIAGEDSGTTAQREELSGRVGRLEEARRLCSGKGRATD